VSVFCLDFVKIMLYIWPMAKLKAVKRYVCGLDRATPISIDALRRAYVEQLLLEAKVFYDRAIAIIGPCYLAGRKCACKKACKV